MKTGLLFISAASSILLASCSSTVPLTVANQQDLEKATWITLETKRVVMSKDSGMRTGVMPQQEAVAAFKEASRVRGAKSESIHQDKAMVRGGRMVSGFANNHFPHYAFGETWMGTQREVQLQTTKHGMEAVVSYDHQVLAHPSGELSELQKPLSGKEQVATYIPAKKIKEAVSFAGGESKASVRVRTAGFKGSIPYGSALVLKTSGSSTMTEYVMFTFSFE
ncbi:hypothetical protein OKA04_17715 [Luteolibacter flavescens]|uniref:Lipoprotein n=1 Tax=Luteolibacter flavescens TaxID=1859460 RepID=A0ABT3FSM8_9BACT|nr:hypothetical protein [Luteolibacter flavescens]MCW1886580.1 hypothetical protein [Luteolibacter flavescens]